MDTNLTRNFIPKILHRHLKRTNDPIGDLITRIRNGYGRSFDSIIVPKSTKIKNILDALVRAGYILNYEDNSIPKKVLSSIDLFRLKKEEPLFFRVFLKYHLGLPALQNIQRVSTPSKRIYLSKKKIKHYSKLQNWGLTKVLILSTSQGVFTHQEIMKSQKTMGGESLCIVW